MQNEIESNLRYFIHLAYNGKGFHGWQLQNGQRSVQGVINDAISKVLRLEINIAGCGRTDAGVHASDFYAHFDYPELLDEMTCEKLCFKLNSMLGSEIVIFKIFAVGPKFSARFDADARTYQYRIARKKNPFTADFSYHLFGKLDLDKMNQACAILVEYKDFECFSKVKTQVNNFLCDISYAKWSEEGDSLIFEIKANRFLRNMVRAIVGTMLDIGLGKVDLEGFRAIIESKSRAQAGFSVPAKGLFLTRVDYPVEVFGQ
jgi:tRNA pseudouridine38-40 synthase